MSPEQIERFFRLLAKELPKPVTVILTGAAAGSLMGHVRPSLDIDFAIFATRSSSTSWRTIEDAVERVGQLTGIRPHYAEDIDRWSSVVLHDYRQRSRLYRRFGRLAVRLLDPATWAIGKLSRYLPQDIDDLVAILSRQRLSAATLVSRWAQALRRSPRSQALTLFRDHVEDFLRTHGTTIWGRSFDPEHTIHRFRQHLAA